MIVEAAGPDDARAAEADGAEAIVVRGELAGVREATELPILWCRAGSLDDAKRAGEIGRASCRERVCYAV